MIVRMNLTRCLRLHVFGLLLLAAVMPASAQEKMVLGIALGAPFRTPACKAGETATASRLCFKDAMKHFKLPGFTEYIVANMTKGPPYMRGDIHVMVRDGMVESIQIGTWGIEYQDNAFKALSDEYGPPTRTWRDKPKGLRARISTLYADWDLRDFSVKFYGSVGSIDWGRVEASTYGYRKRVEDQTDRAADTPAK
jgi:hypothetical protein